MKTGSHERENLGALTLLVCLMTAFSPIRPTYYSCIWKIPMSVGFALIFCNSVDKKIKCDCQCESQHPLSTTHAHNLNKNLLINSNYAFRRVVSRVYVIKICSAVMAKYIVNCCCHWRRSNVAKVEEELIWRSQMIFGRKTWDDCIDILWSGGREDCLYIALNDPTCNSN